MFNRIKKARDRACRAIAAALKRGGVEAALEVDRLEGRSYIGYWSLGGGDKVCVLSENIFNPEEKIFVERYELKSF